MNCTPVQHIIRSTSLFTFFLAEAHYYASLYRLHRTLARGAATLDWHARDMHSGRALFINKLLAAAGSPHWRPGTRMCVICRRRGNSSRAPSHTAPNLAQKPRLSFLEALRRVLAPGQPAPHPALSTASPIRFVFVYIGTLGTLGARCCPRDRPWHRTKLHAAPAIGQALRRVSIAVGWASRANGETLALGRRSRSERRGVG